MDQPEVVAALSVIGWIELIKRIGGFMVIAGVAIEVGGDWLSGPYHKIADDARELQIAQLTKDAGSARAAIADATVEAAKANARTAEIYAKFAARELKPEDRKNLAEKMRDKQYKIDVRMEWDRDAVEYGKGFIDAFSRVDKLVSGQTAQGASPGADGIRLADSRFLITHGPPTTDLLDFVHVLSEFCDPSTIRIMDWRQIPRRSTDVGPLASEPQPPPAGVILMYVGVKPPVPLPPLQ